MFAREAIIKYMKGRDIQSPAFEYDGQKGFTPSADSRRVLDELGRLGGKPLQLRAANSVELGADGKPMWDSGTALIEHDLRGGKTGSEAVIDPFKGTSYAVAHEGAHAVAPSSYVKEILQKGVNPSDIDLSGLPRDSRLGQHLSRKVIPIAAEETHATAVGSRIAEKLGIPGDPFYKNPLDYGMSVIGQGIDEYASKAESEPTPGEQRAIDDVVQNAPALLKRVYEQGRSLVR